MTFKKANSILTKRFSYYEHEVPTDKEIRDAIWAFGREDGSKSCFDCKRYGECVRKVSININCNFYKGVEK